MVIRLLSASKLTLNLPLVASNREALGKLRPKARLESRRSDAALLQAQTRHYCKYILEVLRFREDPSLLKNSFVPVSNPHLGPESPGFRAFSPVWDHPSVRWRLFQQAGAFSATGLPELRSSRKLVAGIKCFSETGLTATSPLGSSPGINKGWDHRNHTFSSSANARCTTQLTKAFEIEFRVLLTNGATEVRFERVGGGVAI